MNNRLAICLSLVLLAAFAAAPAFAQADGPTGTPVNPTEQPTAAPSGSGTPVNPTEQQPGATGGADNAAGNSPAGTRSSEDGGNGQYMMFLLIGLLILMFVFSSRSRKKQEAKRREMLDAIKKGDTVTSIGGIIGTVIELRDRDLIIKVDDTTRIKLARWAIRGIGEDSMTDTPEKKGDEKK